MKVSTYDLTDAGNLGLEDSDGVTDGWLLVSAGGGSERSSRGVHHEWELLLGNSCQHFYV